MLVGPGPSELERTELCLIGQQSMLVGPGPSELEPHDNAKL
jgi:hypothetical protein